MPTSDFSEIGEGLEGSERHALSLDRESINGIWGRFASWIGSRTGGRSVPPLTARQAQELTRAKRSYERRQAEAVKTPRGSP
jgi:hypothetical protein